MGQGIGLRVSLPTELSDSEGDSVSHVNCPVNSQADNLEAQDALSGQTSFLSTKRTRGDYLLNLLMSLARCHMGGV